jgi:hypothetical protein
MRTNGTAIYGSTASPFPSTPFRVTSQPRRLNLFVKDWASSLELPGLKTPIARAYMMADSARTPLPVSLTPSGGRVEMPSLAPAVWPVVVVEFETEPQLSR